MVLGKIAVLGCGSWGRNLVRNFHQILGPDQVICCDQSQHIQDEMASVYPGIHVTADVQDVLSDESVRGVAIATPVFSHANLARDSLMSGKHVLVEKPLTASLSEAKTICDLADQNKLVLMVDHLMLFHPAVQALEEMVRSGELGEIYHMYSRRTNLGVIRAEENALWSLGAHDIAVFISLLGELPIEVSALGSSYLRPSLGIHDVAFVALGFPSGTLCHLHLSWHDPRKVRDITVIGSKRMAVFDDGEADDKLRIHDVGVDFTRYGVSSLRVGQIESVFVSGEEPLAALCKQFLENIDGSHSDVSDGRTGLEVVKVLEAAQESLEMGGRAISLGGR